MTENIQVYANGFSYDIEENTRNVVLTGIDASQVLAEFTVEERLESLELSDIADYLTLKENEALEDKADENFSKFLNEDFLTTVNKLSIRGNQYE